MIMKVLKKIGCDPELFLFDNVLDRIVPACGIVEGSKESPIVLNNGGMVQLDGTVLEFGTPPVTPWGKNFSKALKGTLDIIRKQLSDNYGDRYELRCGAMAAYSPEDITPDHAGLIVGCSPQYILINAKTPVRGVLQSMGSLSPDAVPIGGHIHFGFVDEMSGEKVENYSAQRYLNEFTIRGNAQYLNRDVPCAASVKRKKVMGFPEFEPTIRIKSYGVEYRNLSSYWLACPELADLFSRLHNMNTIRCVDHTAPVPFTNPSRAIVDKLTQLGARAQKQDAKYQQTLPLAY